jgi:hypothetical protein
MPLSDEFKIDGGRLLRLFVIVAILTAIGLWFMWRDASHDAGKSACETQREIEGAPGECVFDERFNEWVPR